MLRLLTYLAPSIPADFFRLVAAVIEADVGVAVDLKFEERISGPMPGDENPFAAGTADVGFICSPSYRWQRERLDLLPVPVPVDARAKGQPVYFGDVVVRRGAGVASFADLRGRRWAYNDRNSRSGWTCMLERIAPAEPEGWFSAVIDAGSHLESLRRVREGGADAASIDSNALRLAAARDPALLDDLQILESWGPFPIQPVVIRSAMSPQVRRALRLALLRAHETVGDRLRRFGFTHFAEADPAGYDR